MIQAKVYTDPPETNQRSEICSHLRAALETMKRFCLDFHEHGLGVVSLSRGEVREGNQWIYLATLAAMNCLKSPRHLSGHFAPRVNAFWSSRMFFCQAKCLPLIFLNRRCLRIAMSCRYTAVRLQQQ